MALIHLQHTQKGENLCRRKNTGQKGQWYTNSLYCICLTKGLRFFTAWNIHTNIRLLFLISQKNYFNMYAPLFVWHSVTCRRKKYNCSQSTVNCSHRRSVIVYKRKKMHGKRYVTHTGSLYSGVNCGVPHTKSLDEDIKQGFHSLCSVSERLDS